MARNALEAVFGALGGGLVGYGKDKNLRMDREEERLARELAARQSADQRQIGLVSAGFEDEGTLRKRPATMRTAGAAAQAIPMSGTIGSALDVASRQMDSNISGGRRVTLSDNTTYVQPYDRTPQGLAEAEARLQRERDDRLAAQALVRDEANNAASVKAAGARATVSTLNENSRDLADRRRRGAAEYQRRLAQGKTVPNPLSAKLEPITVRYEASDLDALRRDSYAPYGIDPEGNELPDGPPASATGTGSVREWMAGNAKNDDESRPAYRARYEASTGAASSSPATSPTPQASAPTATPADSATNSPRVASIKRQLDELSQGRSGSVAARERYQSYAPQREALEQELENLGLRYSRGYITSARTR